MARHAGDFVVLCWSRAEAAPNRIRATGDDFDRYE